MRETVTVKIQFETYGTSVLPYGNSVIPLRSLYTVNYTSIKLYTFITSILLHLFLHCNDTVYILYNAIYIILHLYSKLKITLAYILNMSMMGYDRVCVCVAFQTFRKKLEMVLL